MKRLQPLVHDTVITLAAPTQVLAARGGDIDSRGPHMLAGIWHADVRVLNTVRVLVDGWAPEHIVTEVTADQTTHVCLLRASQPEDEQGADPKLRLDRHCSVAAGVVTETYHVRSSLDVAVDIGLDVYLAADFARIDAVKMGLPPTRPTVNSDIHENQLVWSSDDVTVELTTSGVPAEIIADGPDWVVRWPGLTVPPRAEVEVGWSIHIDDASAAVVSARQSRWDVAPIVTDLVRLSARDSADPDQRLRPWLTRSLSDLDRLRVSSSAFPAEYFFAAGAPWYLTLFGRDISGRPGCSRPSTPLRRDAEDLEVQASKDSPAYGARNVQTVAAGTGEALPGPATCGWCCRSVALYNR